MPKYDLDQIAKDFRASNAAIDPGDNADLALHLRGAEFELAFLLWSYGEGNRGEVSSCQMSKAFGSIVGACLVNYLGNFDQSERNHQLEHFFDQLGGTLTAPTIYGVVEVTPIPGKSDLH